MSATHFIFALLTVCDPLPINTELSAAHLYIFRANNSTEIKTCLQKRYTCEQRFEFAFDICHWTPDKQSIKTKNAQVSVTLNPLLI